MVQAYGEAVAHNIRDCPVSNAAVSLGTLSGMLRYLTAMTHQFAGRTMPITGMIDQGVHNYVVHMRPLAGAWLDPADRIASALHTVTDDTVEITDRGVLVDANPVPVLSHWAERREGGGVRRHIAALSPGRSFPVRSFRTGIGRARCSDRLLPASARRGMARAVSWQPALRQRLRSMHTASGHSMTTNWRY